MKDSLAAERGQEQESPPPASRDQHPRVGRSLDGWQAKALDGDVPRIVERATNLATVSPFALSRRQPAFALMRSPASGLAVNQPGDAYEQEAERVANQVMRTPTPVSVQRRCADCDEGNLLRTCAHCEEEEKKGLHRQETGMGPGIAPPVVHEVLKSPGQPLDPGARAFMEPRFGHDFSQVRVHADTAAGKSAQAVNARAYTVGTHVVFAPGEFAPDRHAGLRLLAHELTHVTQQSGAIFGVSDVSRAAKYLARAPNPTGVLQQEAAESVRAAISFIESLQQMLAVDRGRARREAAGAGGIAEGSRRAHRVLNQSVVRGYLQRARRIYEGQRAILDPNHALLGDLRQAYARFLGEAREAFGEALSSSRNDRQAEIEEEAAYAESLVLWLEASPLRDPALAGRTSFTAADVSASQRQETDLSTVLTAIVPYLNLVQPGMAARARAAIDGTRARITAVGTAPPTRTTAVGTSQTAADTAIVQINGAQQTIDRGRTLLQAAIARLEVWPQAPAQPIDVSDRVHELFSTRDPGYGALLRDRLKLMLDNLEGRGSLFAHMHRTGDTSTCATATTLGQMPRPYEFVFCHIGTNVDSNAGTLLHELAHAVIPGRGSRAPVSAGYPLDRAYESERLLRRMSTEEALNNAESYAEIILILAGISVKAIPVDIVTGCADSAPLLDALALAQSAHRRAWSHLEEARDALDAGTPVQPWLQTLINTHLGSPAAADLRAMLRDFGNLQSDATTWQIGHTFTCAPARECPADVLAFSDRRAYRSGAVAAHSHRGRNPSFCPAFFALGADDRARMAHVIVSLSFADSYLLHPERVWGYASLALALYHGDIGAPPASSLAEHQAADVAATPHRP